MFARILHVGAFEDPSERDWRLAETMEGMGHAVRRCPPEPEELNAAARAFRPTLALWDSGSLGAPDERCLEVLRRREGCAVHVLDGDSGEHGPSGAGALADAFPDRRYQEAIGSDPDKPRNGILVEQERTEAREEQLARLGLAGAEQPGGLQPVLVHGSWDPSLCGGDPGAARAFHRRYCRYALFFDGEDSPGAWELGRAMAEGAIVLAEKGALEGVDEALRDAVPSWGHGGLGDLLEHLEGDEAARLAARQKQQALLGARPTLEERATELLIALDEAQRAAGGPPVLAQSEPARQVMLFGWFGAQNYGDDLLMGMTAQRIMERIPNGQVVVIGADPKRIRRNWGYEAFSPDQKGPISRALSRSCALVCCGGLIFDDPLAQTAGTLEFCLDPWIEPTGQAALALLARSYGVPTIYLGAGAGPIRNGATQRAALLIGLAGTRFLLRDEESCHWLLNAGVSDEQVALRADLAFDASDYIDAHSDASLEGTLPDQIQEEGYFVVSLRQWHLNPPAFATTVAAAVDAVVERTGCFALFLPFDEEDSAIHHDVVAQMRHGDKAVALASRPTEGQLLCAVKGSKAALAMRLHCSILHHVIGKPAVGLNYNDKVEAHFGQIGRTGFLLGLDASAESMADSLLAALEEARLDDQSRSLLQEKAGLVREAFEELPEDPRPVAQGLAERLVLFPRETSHDHQRAARAEAALQQQDARVAALEAKLASARAEAEALRGSRSYRIGHALVKPLAAVRNRMRRH